MEGLRTSKRARQEVDRYEPADYRTATRGPHLSIDDLNENAAHAQAKRAKQAGRVAATLQQFR